ncbi:MAG: anthranilate phosphoribosyltransferase [Clostridium sp.]|nr:anthranilate phosphoribosyltransferase [Clostridium sp.]
MRDILSKLCARINLTEEEARAAMTSIMNGEATPAQIAAFLVAMKMKGETVAEVYGCASVMRERAEKVESTREGLTDTCGTGGDNRGTFNISTAAALVAAGAGLSLAKHGNRAVSSKCGSADVLEALGIKLELTPQEMGKCLNELGIAFLYAPVLHQSMRHAAVPRREVGVRSVFNLLGPLTNPAKVMHQVLGVCSPELMTLLADVLLLQGVKHALVVHGQDGSDELTLSGVTHICEVREGRMVRYNVTPQEVGLQQVSADALAGGGPAENAKLILAVLQGKKGPEQDVVLLNAAAALYVGGMAENIREGVVLAQLAINSGAALEKLTALQRFAGGEKNAFTNCG